ncbi:MAG TPA: PspA/IM30 family protein [Polyangiaceae bacterium]|jgi:phage shock protein A|nr:PspA/IM30 family protein [Polyangiaceae bacterium]
MRILSRVAQVMSANFNALLDKADDPRKSLELTLQEMREQINAARKEVVSAVGSEKRLKKKVEELDLEVEKWNGRAELAVRSNDDALAREALLQKRRAVAERDRAEADRAEQRGSALEMKEALERMEQKVKEFELRTGTIATRAEQARAGGGVESLGRKGDGPGAFDEFRRMEDKIENAEYTVSALGDVENVLTDRGPSGMSKAEVEARFRALESSTGATPAVPEKSEVDDELQALKKKIRIQT